MQLNSGTSETIRLHVIVSPADCLNWRREMKIHLILILIIPYKVLSLPSRITNSKLLVPATTESPAAIVSNVIPSSSTRKKKGPSLPYQYQIQQLYVPNLHVIPLNSNTSHINSIPVFIPVHNLLPVHDLTVIPLRVTENVYRMNNDRELYRNPLGGYGVGWRFGGHGAGHGFHYAYG
ncbi:hypothetical protein KGM_204721 [Danaus plexippus plexippus]|uniref:Uncharacterized protein n=1 Tax=Danaus plexippus plexippus TaxID=278856 RepID=A0A212F7F7_DANPL|nr:hypothetical protein KGM_204721 [Danaus plexippus plexippus]